MPRRKKLDLTPVVEAIIAEIDFRITRSVTDAVRDIEKRIERLEKRLTGGGGRLASVRTPKVCRRPGCTSRVIAHGLCSRHYQQWRYQSKKSERAASAETVEPIKTTEKKRTRRTSSTNRPRVKR